MDQFDNPWAEVKQELNSLGTNPAGSEGKVAKQALDINAQLDQQFFPSDNPAVTQEYNKFDYSMPSNVIPNPLFNPFEITEATALGIPSGSLGQVRQNEDLHQMPILGPDLHTQNGSILDYRSPLTSTPIVTPLVVQTENFIDPLNSDTGGLLTSDSDPQPTQNVQKEQSLPYKYQIKVANPLKVGDKLSGYVEYNIRGFTDNPEFRNPEIGVMRRYSDFLWLYNQLCNQYVGIIIPPIPEKLQIGRYCFIDKISRRIC
jgi:hypothetical protein